ncbi:MAG: hypothetical protein U9Q15_03815 [Patescibacteria group bacterium]|nr:hypothetical protein [Patescibacteria group bacterium]
MNKLGAIGSTAAVGAVVATGVNMSAPDENKVLTESLQVANPIVKEI